MQYRVRLCLWSLGLCCAFAIPAIVLLWCCLSFIGSRRVFGMVSDGFQAQKRGSWIPGKERAERVLANAISFDGRKEWTCKFCQNRMCGRGGVAGDVTVTSRRGCTGSTGMRLLKKSGEWSTGSSASSREERKSKSQEAWLLRIRSSEQGLMPRKTRKEYKGARYPLKRRRGLGRFVR